MEEFSFGAWVRRRRRALDLTQAALARMAGCAPVTLRKIEADERRPSTQLAERLASLLGLTPAERAAFLGAARATLPAAALPDDAPSAAAAPALAHGPLTLLLTDISDGARLWEDARGPMRAAAARHDAIVHQAAAAHSGRVYKAVGDACFAAFARPVDALCAALAAQRALQAEPWHARGLRLPLRVRMAIHTVADAVGSDAVGPALHRATRLRDIAHGGQVLVSAAARELMVDQLPEGVALRDLGLHRLPDLGRPERVYQAVAPGLDADFAPLRSLPAWPGNLPAPLTPFVGRARELGELLALLRQAGVRLVTLTGPGGTGKTRLALQAAAELAADYPDGAWLADLSAVDDPALVAAALARDLRATVLGGDTPEAALHAFLADRRLLLVLDNCEQVDEAAARVVDDLLRHAPGLQVIATSRAPLLLSAEHEVLVPPMSLPPGTLRARGSTPPATRDTDQVTQYDAVRLFIERAAAARSGFRVTSHSAPAVAEICCRLDGLPLAIELAAARMRALEPEELLAQLDADGLLSVLSGGMRDLPARQRTLRATIDWSYRQLDARGQALLRRLGVFAGGCGAEAVRALCPDEADRLGTLVNHSLVGLTEGPAGAARYVLLEAVREYARERLAADGSLASLQAGHAAFFAAWAEQLRAGLRGPQQAGWLARFEADYENLDAALAWALAQPGSAARASPDLGRSLVGLRIVASLPDAWHLRGRYTDWRRWSALAAALAERIAADVDSTRPAVAAACAGALVSALKLMVQLDVSTGREALLRRAAALAARSGDACLVVDSRLLAAVSVDDVQRATALLEATAAAAREGGCTAALGDALQQLAWHVHIAAPDRAAALLAEALGLARERGDRRAEAEALWWQAKLAIETSGSLDSGERLFERALAICRELGFRLGESSVLYGLMIVAGKRAAYDDVIALNRERYAIELELGKPEAAADALRSIARVAAERGDHDEADALLVRAIALLRHLDEPVQVDIYQAERARVALDRGAFADARALLGLREGEDPRSAQLSVVRLCALAALELAEGRPEIGAELFARTRERAESAGEEGFVVEALHGLGRCALASGSPMAARQRIEAALAYGEAHSDASCLRPLWAVDLADLRLSLAEALLAAGEDERAAAELAAARAIAAAAGARRRLARCDELAAMAAAGMAHRGAST